TQTIHRLVLRQTARLYREDSILPDRRSQKAWCSDRLELKRHQRFIIRRCRLYRRYLWKHDVDAGTAESLARRLDRRQRLRPDYRDLTGWPVYGISVSVFPGDFPGLRQFPFRGSARTANRSVLGCKDGRASPSDPAAN